MEHLILQISKYLMTALIFLYAVLSLFDPGEDIEEGRSVLSLLQRFFLFSLHLVGFLVLYLNDGGWKVVALYAAQLVFLLMYMTAWRAFYPAASLYLINHSCLLLVICFIIQTRLNYDKSVRQFIIVLLAAGVTMIIPAMTRRMKILEKGGYLYAIVGIGLLGAVYAAGNTEFGANLSFTIGSFTLQPSEFVKILFVFFTASLLARDTSFKKILLTTALAAAHVLILVMSKDLGTAMIFFFAYLCMLFIATGRLLYPVAGLGAGAVASVGAYHIFAHVRTRVEVWANPWADVTGDGWQILQSLFAVGTGGWFGLGLCQGSATTIPVVTKDFVFSAISSEMGGVFAICLIVICMEVLFQFFRIATWMTTPFQKITVFGLAVVYGSQVFINVAGVMKFIPSTGITLPFISYGGSSVLATFLMFAVIQGYKIHREDEEEELLGEGADEDYDDYEEDEEYGR